MVDNPKRFASLLGDNSRTPDEHQEYMKGECVFGTTTELMILAIVFETNVHTFLVQDVGDGETTSGWLTFQSSGPGGRRDNPGVTGRGVYLRNEGVHFEPVLGIQVIQ
jgi:hypothetical protein